MEERPARSRPLSSMGGPGEMEPVNRANSGGAADAAREGA